MVWKINIGRRNFQILLYAVFCFSRLNYIMQKIPGAVITYGHYFHAWCPSVKKQKLSSGVTRGGGQTASGASSRKAQKVGKSPSLPRAPDTLGTPLNVHLLVSPFFIHYAKDQIQVGTVLFEVSNFFDVILHSI